MWTARFTWKYSVRSQLYITCERLRERLTSFAKCTDQDSREQREREAGRGTTAGSAPAEI